MVNIANKKGYILYYDSKYHDFLVVTPNYKITRYWKRLDKDISDYFDEKSIEYLKNINK